MHAATTHIISQLVTDTSNTYPSVGVAKHRLITLKPLDTSELCSVLVLAVVVVYCTEQISTLCRLCIKLLLLFLNSLTGSLLHQRTRGGGVRAALNTVHDSRCGPYFYFGVVIK